MVIFFAYFIRNSDHDKETGEYLDDNINLDLANDEEYFHSIQVCFITHLKIISFE